MLSDDKQINKDFNINNHYINLNFNSWEQEFEFKWPHLDHPSNYQMIVTKFMTRLNHPYICLHESKKNPKAVLTQNDSYLFDYLTCLEFEELNNGKIENTYFTYSLEKLFPDRLTDSEAPMLRTIIEDNPFLDEKGKVIDGQDEEAIDWEPEDIEDMPSTDYRWNGKGWKANQVFWYDKFSFNDLFSIEEFLSIVNNALKKCVKNYIDKFLPEYDKETGEKIEKDTYHENIAIQLKIADDNIYYRLNNGRLELVINEDLANAINTSNKYEHRTEEKETMVLDEKGNPVIDNKTKKPKINKESKDVDNRFMRISFSKNLFRYLKSIHMERNWENDNYYLLNISKEAVAQAEKFVLNKELKEQLGTWAPGGYEITYCVFKGEKINIMDWSDFVGLVVTSPDFPVKQQIYPHFYYVLSDDHDGKINRRRYKNTTENNILGFKPTSGAASVNYTQEMFGDEDQNEQYMKGTEEPIVFLKYFSKDEDFNCLNYENNDGYTSLRMDIKNVMPLQKFTMRVYLIDRWGNFTPIVMGYGQDNIVKMQILFQRIKGAEKENRYISSLRKERLSQ